MNIAGIPTRLRYHWPVACLVVIVSLLHSSGWQVDARDLVAPKEQSTTEIDPTQSPSFDEQKKGIPQSLFTWIKMAKGYDVEWDSFGRKGWYTQDPRLKPSSAPNGSRKPPKANSPTRRWEKTVLKFPVMNAMVSSN